MVVSISERIQSRFVAETCLRSSRVPHRFIIAAILSTIHLLRAGSRRGRGHFRLINGPNGAQIHEATGSLTWTPTANGTYAFLEAAVDSYEACTTMAFEVVVDATGGNRPPRFDRTDIGFAEIGTLYDRRFPATDPDGDRLTYSLAVKPNGMTIDGTGRVRWNPPTSLAAKPFPSN